MSERSDWASLRDRRMTTPEARAGYEAEKRAYELGEAIRELRTARGLTQAQLGRRARLTQSAVARLESGDVVPTLRVLERIAEALGTELEVSLRTPKPPTGAPGKPVPC